jgi:hypothetical protein
MQRVKRIPRCNLPKKKGCRQPYFCRQKMPLQISDYVGSASTDTVMVTITSVCRATLTC